MPNIVTIKDGKVNGIIFSVDADGAVLSDVAEVGDVYDPKTGTFSKPVPPTPPEPTAEELAAKAAEQKRQEDIAAEADRQRQAAAATLLARKAKIQAGIDELAAQKSASAADDALLETLKNGLDDVNAKLSVL